MLTRPNSKMDNEMVENESEEIAINNISLAIRDIYHAFNVVPMPKFISGCACGSCLTTEDLMPLLQQNLRKIPFDSIDGYAESVLVTIGSKEDLMYFLPRLLELRYVNNEGYPLGEELHGKLQEMKWNEWDSNLVTPINELFKTVFINLNELPFFKSNFNEFLDDMKTCNADYLDYLNLVPNKDGFLEWFFKWQNKYSFDEWRKSTEISKQ